MSVLQSLPVQESTHVSETALVTMMEQKQVLTPRNLDLSSFSHGGRTIAVPVSPDMNIRLHAFLAANSLVFLSSNSSRVQTLLDAELKELTDGASRVAPPDGTLYARRMSLVGLARGTNSHGGGLDLLNAVANLAAVSAPGELPMARNCRMTYLAGEDAEKYLSDRRSALPEASRRLELIPPVDGTGTSSIAVTWSVRMGTQTVVHMRIGQLPALARGNVVEMTDNIVTAISEICAGNGILAPSSLCAQRSSPTSDSFVETQISSHRAFAKLLMPDPVIEMSPHGMSESAFKLDFAENYVRLVTRSFAITHSSTFTGLLLHEAGKKEQVDAWLNMLRSDETSQIYGLRPPQNSYEEQLGLHVLAAHVAPITLGSSVSCYGLAGHPGKRLSVRDGCSLFCIQRSIRPLEAWIQSGYFVLPCTKESAVPNAVELRLPFFEMLENAVKAMLEAFEEGARASGPVKLELTKSIDCANKQTPEERFYGTAWGLGLEVEASTVGSVYEELAKRTAATDALSLLFLAMVSKVGKNASVVDAWTWMKESIINSSKRIRDLELEVEQLRAQSLPTDVAPVCVVEEPVTEPALPVDHLLLNLSDTSIKGLAAVCGLQPGVGSLTMHNTASENEIDRLLTLFAKSLGTSKRKMPTEVVAAAKAKHATVTLEAPLTRVLAVAGVVEGGTRPSLRTSVYVVSQSSTTSRLFEALASGERRVNIDSFISQQATLIHLVESTCTLYYFYNPAASS